MIDPTAMIEEITTLEQRLRNTNRRNATYALQISELQNRIEELETQIVKNNLDTAQHCLKLVKRIAELEAELAKTKEGLSLAVEAMVKRWIPVSERLPEVYDDYLVYGKYYEDEQIFTIVTFEPDTQRWHHLAHITHWMPLPEPPEEVE